jgi:hypothetical protein
MRAIMMLKQRSILKIKLINNRVERTDDSSSFSSINISNINSY